MIPVQNIAKLTASTVNARGAQGLARNKSLPNLRPNDPLAIFMRLKASVSGADRSNQDPVAPSQTRPLDQPVHLAPRVVATPRTPASAIPPSSDVDAMDIDQADVSSPAQHNASPAVGQSSSSARRMTLSGNPNASASKLPRPIRRTASMETGLESRLASMNIRKVKALPVRTGPTTPKKNHTTVLPPDAPKKLRTTPPPPPALSRTGTVDVLPSLPRKSILKRKADDNPAATKRARIVPEAPTIIVSPPPAVKNRRKSVGGRFGGRGSGHSPSKYAAGKAAGLRRRQSAGGAFGMDVDRPARW